MATVLVVDDELDVLMLVRAGLEAAGHTVVLASDGRMALARLAEQRPDAVVLDLLMPVLDGLAVLDDLRRRELTVPVVVLLAGPEAADAGRRALERGALGFHAKPVGIGALCTTVAEVLALADDEERSAYRQLALHALDALADR